MKYQYFGDISDYKKYGVLRALSNKGKVKIIVCWMLTSSDIRSDGNNNKYLHKSEQFRSHDPEVFDFLYKCVVVKREKNLKLVDKNNIVTGAKYFNDELLDNLSYREAYFTKLNKQAKGCDLIFLDPDNGICTQSVKKGRKNSSKYIFWDEIGRLWNNGYSLLIYQHFPRVNRQEYINGLSKQLQKLLQIKQIYAIKTTFMVYFLIIQPNHRKKLIGFKERINKKWKEIINILCLAVS